MKTSENNSYGWTWLETTFFLYSINVEERERLCQVVQIDICRLPKTWFWNHSILHSILLAVVCLSGVRKPPTFRDATTNFPAKWRLRNEGRNSVLMTYRYPDISSASDWLDICFNQSEALFRSGLWVKRHQYGSNYCASGFFTWSLGETSGGGRLEM